MSKKHHLLQIAALSCALWIAPALTRAQNPQAPDNSAQNKNQQTTADQQSHTTSDRAITRKIRQAVVADKSLSTYGHNVKIITQNGAVTLKGTVHSDDEKKAIEQHAAEVAGQDKVTDQLMVKQ